MSKKKKNKSSTANTENLASLTKEQSQTIQKLMKELISFEAKENWPVPAPVDVVLWKLEDGRLASAFFFSHALPMDPNTMRFAVPMSLEVAQDAVERGQEALWEWLRNAAVWICTSAVAQDMPMPDRIILQISDVVRYHDVDQDKEFLAGIREAAKHIAMHAAMGEGVSE
jgi:hypothetical protein